VPAIGDSVRLRAEEVRELQPGGTRRKPGIGIFVGDNRNLRFIIVGSDGISEVHSKIVKILAVGAVSAGQSLHIGRAAAAALVSYSHR
jgi:hypothetical protein